MICDIAVWQERNRCNAFTFLRAKTQRSKGRKRKARGFCAIGRNSDFFAFLCLFASLRACFGCS